MNYALTRQMLRAAVVVAFALGFSSTDVATATAQSSRPAVLSAPEIRESAVLERGGYAVVVDLDENELHFLQGRTVLWSAPVGTGMGLRLRDGDREWNFVTPTGVFQVQAKEENPTWYAPDWYFIENNREVPPRGDPRRRFPGSLGAAAVYIGRGMAIHGTDKPDLLGQRISHGCIRLANEYAQRLYHNVQIGTEVIIVGTVDLSDRGELIPGRVPGTEPPNVRTARLRERAKSDRERMLADLAGATHESLAERLTVALRSSADAEWPAIAGELIRRAKEDDDLQAAQVLLEHAWGIGPRRVRAEYATFAADLAARRGVLTARALAALPDRTRARVARVIAETAVYQFTGEPGAPGLPWPTRRILARMVDEEARPGWEALAEAERTARSDRAPMRGAGGR